MAQCKAMIGNLNRLYLSITNACNLHCRHCFRSAGNAFRGELTTDEYEKILVSAEKEVHSKQISITGGEPFMRSDLFDILDITKHLDLSVDLSTNGLLLSEMIINKLEDYDNIFYTQISVDGIHKDTYEFIRGKDTFHTLIHNLEILKQSEFLSQIDLMMIFLVTPKNYMEIVELPEFALKYGFDKIAIGEILPFGNGAFDFEEMDTSSLMQQIYHNINIARQKKIVTVIDQFHFGFLYTGMSPTPCTAKQGKVLAIEPNGEVLFCPYDVNVSVGNIRDFNYDIRVAYEKAMEMGRSLSELNTGLKECQYYDSCQGGCPLIIKRNHSECDERCRKYQEKLYCQKN